MIKKESLSVKYRPKKFEDVLGQEVVVNTLKRQLETNTFKNVYLFCGPSGDGKTTIARIFANEINKGLGNPIEIDAASNSGVDNVREIIEEAKLRALDSEYKVYIIDETHSLTIQAWQAFLKCLEEPPQYTIFIFCTTNPEKIPATIQNRVMRFNLTKVKTQLIKSRLLYICSQESYTNYEEACDYISKISGGGVRDAISTLEKCASYSSDLNINNVLKSLGESSYDTYFNLTNKIIDFDRKSILSIVDNLYNQGIDLKLFINNYLDVVLDLTKYCIFKDIAVTKLPSTMLDTHNELCIKYVTGIENNIELFTELSNKLLELKYLLRNDTSVLTTVELYLIKIGKDLTKC